MTKIDLEEFYYHRAICLLDYAEHSAQTFAESLRDGNRDWADMKACDSISALHLAAVRALSWLLLADDDGKDKQII